MLTLFKIWILSWKALGEIEESAYWSDTETDKWSILDKHNWVLSTTVPLNEVSLRKKIFFLLFQKRSFPERSWTAVDLKNSCAGEKARLIIQSLEYKTNCLRLFFVRPNKVRFGSAGYEAVNSVRTRCPTSKVQVQGAACLVKSLLLSSQPP